MNLEIIQEKASQYGYVIADDGIISTQSGKNTNVQIVSKKNKIIVQSTDGKKLASLKDENAIGWFLETYWYATKKTK